ncbi:hypothetical protein BJP36_37570 [Moorena producens JHB]|uniref:Uncharacterized protein n=1 Tax=Moorena producens (strain JHB) TaxID=1454205 RepID=A0A9Q9SUD5_MOOP1|nr:hypothetical protein [Moorena producens]WAN69805.1 hypothetical protein BJP36_37570 [Moorena producens JHB]
MAALPPQDRNGAFSVMARDCSPSRVAPLHRLFKSCSLCLPYAHKHLK